MARVKPLPRCSICRQQPTIRCDWRQGRCPNIPPVLKLTFVDKIINRFKRKSK
jgi:hypothetical protein